MLTNNWMEDFFRAWGYELKNKYVSKEEVTSPYDVSSIVYDFPYTLVNWKDGTVTIVKCMKGDKFSRSVGFSMALAKKLYGKQQFKKMIEEAYIQKPTE